MTENRTAESKLSTTTPRPISAIKAAINDRIVLCEWFIDRYDTRNDAPTDDPRNIEDLGLKLADMATEISKLLREGEPWLSEETGFVDMHSGNVQSLRNFNREEDSHHEVVTVTVRQGMGGEPPHNNDPHQVPAEIAALLNWTMTIEVLNAELVDADQAGEREKAVAMAEAITRVCEQVRGDWTPPEGKVAAINMSAKNGWPMQGRLGQAAPQVAEKMMAAVVQARQHLEI